MMAYQDGFVVSILVNGKSFREINQANQRVVKIPFGSEYTIRLKNKNNFKAKARVSIDGTDVLFGSELVLNPHETIDLERFLSSDDSGKKFKFISLEEGSKTGEIQDPTSEENGKVEVDFFCEDLSKIKSPNIAFDTGFRGSQTGILRSHLDHQFICSHPSSSSLDCQLNSVTTTTAGDDIVLGDQGATVEGDLSDQSFRRVADFPVIRSPIKMEILLKGIGAQKQTKWGVFKVGSSEALIESYDKKLLFPVVESMDEEVTIKKV